MRSSRALEQTIDDPAGDHDWRIRAEVDLDASAEEGAAVVRVTEVVRALGASGRSRHRRRPPATSRGGEGPPAPHGSGDGEHAEAAVSASTSPTRCTGAMRSFSASAARRMVPAGYIAPSTAATERSPARMPKSSRAFTTTSTMPHAIASRTPALVAAVGRRGPRNRRQGIAGRGRGRRGAERLGSGHPLGRCQCAGARARCRTVLTPCTHGRHGGSTPSTVNMMTVVTPRFRMSGTTPLSSEVWSIVM